VLKDVKRGASVLSTMSAMLEPRMADGKPERDLALGISLQVSTANEVWNHEMLWLLN
jgi:hypothetical protein